MKRRAEIRMEVFLSRNLIFCLISSMIYFGLISVFFFGKKFSWKLIDMSFSGQFHNLKTILIWKFSDLWHVGFRKLQSEKCR